MRSKISALGVKRALIILAESLFIISLFFVSGAVIKNDAEASYNNKSRSFNKSYYFDRYRNFYNSVGQHIVDRRRITSGYAYANHTVGMTAGGYSVNVGNPINFEHSPTLTFVNYGGAWDTPYGTWCSNINSKCTSGWGGIAYDGISSNYAYVHWTGLRPGAYVTSSNANVISCSGMNCTANRPGTATLTAYGNNTPARIWVYTGFANNTNWVFTSETHEASLNGTTYMNNRMTIGGGTIGSWNITVPRTNPTAVIDSPSNSTYAQGDAITFKGHGVLGAGGGVIDARAWVDVNPGTPSYDGGVCNGSHGTTLHNGNDSFTTSSLSPGTHRICYNVRQRYVDGVQWWAGSNVEYRDITINAAPVTGACGTANGVAYAVTATGYAPNTQCSPGTPNNTNFPEIGGSESWTCLGSGGGGNSPEPCSASRNDYVGACNAAVNNQSYSELTEAEWNALSLCEINNIASISSTDPNAGIPTAPAEGEVVTWWCHHTDNGSVSTQCLARNYGSPEYQCRLVDPAPNCSDNDPVSFPSADYCGNCSSPQTCEGSVSRYECKDIENTSQTLGDVDETKCSPACSTLNSDTCGCVDPSTDVTNWIEVPANQ